MKTDPKFVARRAIQAHPWLEAAGTSGPNELTILATSNPQDPADGHIEGRIHWHTNPSGSTTYRTDLAYEGPGGTFKGQQVMTTDFEWSRTWVDLLDGITAKLNNLHEQAREAS